MNILGDGKQTKIVIKINMLVMVKMKTMINGGDGEW